MKQFKRTLFALTTAGAVLLTACSDKENSKQETSTAQSTESSQSTISSVQSTVTTQSTASSAQTESTAQSSAESTASLTDSTVEIIVPVPPDENGTIIGAELVLNSGRSIMLSSTNSINGANYAQTVNRYKETFPDVQMYSIIVPTAISFYLPERFKEYDPGERGHIDGINAQLKGVTPVDVFSVLARHTDEPIYFNTDHHWTQLGAFYGAEEFARVAGVDFKPISEFEKKDGGDFIGSAYGNSGEDERIKALVEPFTYYVPKSDFDVTFYDLDGTNPIPFFYFANPDELDAYGKYSLYMYGDGHIVHLNTSCKNGRRVLILKEAFANPFCVNLVNSFEDIWIADMKYMETTAEKLINDNGITDLLFCLSTYSTSGVNQEFLADVMQ